MSWRKLTEQEEATLPQARLGGALLWMLAVACVLVVIAVLGTLFAFPQFRAIGGRYMIAISFITVWSALFVILTLLRAPITPMLTTVGLVAWIVYRLSVAILSEAGWPLVVDGVGELILAAGFCGYMATGMRPNAYYRRRLQTP